MRCLLGDRWYRFVHLVGVQFWVKIIENRQLGTQGHLHLTVGLPHRPAAELPLLADRCERNSDAPNREKLLALLSARMRPMG